jgi:hypothetical protein
VQEIAFTLANAIAYVQAAIDAGLDVDDFAPRLSFFWNGHNHFFEEVAKFRASRRMWHRIMTERFDAKKPASKRCCASTPRPAGPPSPRSSRVNNVVRVALQALAAVMGGTQSLHTNGYDEALVLPTEEAARIALRTQQIIGYESGVADTPDPLAGSYLVESLTDEVEAAGVGVHREASTSWAARSPRSRRLPDGRDRAGGLRVHEVDRRRRARDRRRQQVHRRQRAEPRGLPDRPHLEAASRSAWPRTRPTAISTPSGRASTTCGPRRAAPTTCCTR